MNDIQVQQLFANWCFLLNHPDLYNLPIYSRITQLQHAANTNKSILTLAPTIFPIAEAKTTTAQTVLLFNDLKFSTTVLSNLNQHILPFAGLSINHII